MGCAKSKQVPQEDLSNRRLTLKLLFQENEEETLNSRREILRKIWAQIDWIGMVVLQKETTLMGQKFIKNIKKKK